MKVWFYVTASGRSPVEEFIQDLSPAMRSDFFDAVAMLEAGQTLSMPHSRNLSGVYSGLHELRLRDRTGQVRIFYYIKKQEAIYIVHAFRKKTQEIPKGEIDLVLKRIKEV